MVKEFSRYLAWNPGTGHIMTWVERVKVAENGVTVLEDLSGWEQAMEPANTCTACGAWPGSESCSC